MQQYINKGHVYKSDEYRMCIIGLMFSVFYVVLAFCVFPHTTHAGLTDGLVGHWTFDGKDTPWTSATVATTKDKSGSGNTGTLTNMSRSNAPTLGKVGQGLKFDGVNDYVNGGNSFNFTSSNFSIAYWIKLNSFSTNIGGQGPVPIFKGGYSEDGYYSQIESNGNIFFVTSQSGAVQSTHTGAGALIDTKNWHHVVYTRSGSSVFIFLDGVDKTTTHGTHINPASSGENFMIGRYGSGPGGEIYTNGQIDDVRIYNRALSATEIQQLYKLGGSKLASSSLTPSNSGLVGYWTLDNRDTTWTSTTAATTKDRSVGNNTGTLINMNNTSSPVTGRVGQAFNFDGVDDYVTIGDKSSLEINNNSLSFGGWFYLNTYPTVNNRMFLISKGGTVIYYEYELTVSGYSSNHFTATLFSTGFGNYITAMSTTVPPLNTWFHVMGVWDKDAGSMKIYYNGVLENTDTTPNGAIHTTRDANFEIGRRGDNAEKSLNGKADEVRIYNRALSATEIKQLYEENVSKFGVTPTKSNSSGLVGHWTFDGKDTPWTSSSAGTAIDKSGNGNTGTLTNMNRASAPKVGKLGQGLKFDGVDDYIVAGNPSWYGTAWTWSAWVYLRQNPPTINGFTIINHGTGFTGNGAYWNVYNTAGVSQLFITTNKAGTSYQASDSGAFPLNSWQFVTATKNGSTLTLYRNGIVVGTGVDSGSIAPTGNMEIGRYTTGAHQYWQGNIDDVRIYNRALSATEIKQLYTLGQTKVR